MTRQLPVLDLGAEVPRRDFINRGTLSAVAAILAGGCKFGATTAPHAGPVAMSVTVASFPALANVGGMARVDNGSSTPVALVRTGASTFAAFSLVCPHNGCTVGVGNGQFQCPCHGATFDATGTWIGGQQTGNLSSLTASYNAGTGVVSISNAGGIPSGGNGGGDE